MRYRAGLGSKRSIDGTKKSEYQKMFRGKQCDRVTPVLAANQVTIEYKKYVSLDSLPFIAKITG